MRFQLSVLWYVPAQREPYQPNSDAKRVAQTTSPPDGPPRQRTRLVEFSVSILRT